MTTPVVQRLLQSRACSFLGAAVLFVTALHAGAAEETNASKLTVKRIFASGDFGGEGFSARWMDDSSGYTTFEASKAPGGGRDLVRHHPKTGAKDVLVSAAEFVPPGESSPIGIDGHTWSKDRSKLLIFTNTKKVWRTNSRGDYWVLDRTSHELIKLGGDAEASTLMFAKFSPDGRRLIIPTVTGPVAV